MPLKSEFYIDSIHHHDTITIKSYCEEVNEDMYLITSFYFKDSQLVKKEQKEVVHDQDTNSAFDIERQRILIRRMIRNK